MPASCPLLPLRDGRGSASCSCDCRSLFALGCEVRRGNFNVGGAGKVLAGVMSIDKWSLQDAPSKVRPHLTHPPS